MRTQIYSHDRGQPHRIVDMVALKLTFVNRVVTVPVTFGNIDPFSVEALECYEHELRTFNKRQDGAKIRAILLANPNNPMGKCYVGTLFPIRGISVIFGKLIRGHN